MKEQPNIVFTNNPDMRNIMQVLCDLLERQDGGAYEYTYTLTKIKDKEKGA